MAKSQRVRDYMSRRPLTVTPDLEIMRAVFLLVEKDISGLPVLDAAGSIVGILTERDCIRVALDAGYHDEPGGQVCDFMTSDPETVAADDSLMGVAVRFRDSRFRRFPVLEDGLLVGIISRRDILRALKRGVWFEPSE